MSTKKARLVGIHPNGLCRQFCCKGVLHEAPCCLENKSYGNNDDAVNGFAVALGGRKGAFADGIASAAYKWRVTALRLTDIVHAGNFSFRVEIDNNVNFATFTFAESAFGVVQ